MKKRLLGAHVSAAGGTFQAIIRASQMGANCVQVFSASPRVWKRSPLSSIDTETLFAKQEELSVTPIFTHAIYLVNLASEKTELITKSVEVLKYDLEFDALVKGSGVVVHLGSHQGRGWVAVRDQVASEIKNILKSTPQKSHFLIENSAGQKGKLCSDLAEIRWLLDEVGSSRLGWCLDTCHAFAAGKALGYGQDNLEAQIKKYRLWSSLAMIHVNDSRDEFASGRDRHANLGEGKIPATDLAHFLNLPPVKKVPLILEVPGFDGKGPDKKNLDKLRKLVN